MSGRIFPGTTTVRIKPHLDLVATVKGDKEWSWDVKFHFPEPGRLDSERGTLVHMDVEAELAAWVDKAEKDLVTAFCKRTFSVSLSLVEEGPEWLVDFFGGTFNECQKQVVDQLQLAEVKPILVQHNDSRMMALASAFVPQYRDLFPFLPIEV